MSSQTLDMAPLTGRTSERHNLPAEIASFIGRAQEMEDLEALLRAHRLLTLTGPGGGGKTRLALRVAGRMASAFPDGVRLVPLAPLADSGGVTRAVTAALGIQGTADRPLLAVLAAALAPRRLLLVLDNCEHLIGACARLAEILLGACPHLRILATSREPLRIPGEVVRRVPPLGIPGEGPHTPGSLAGVEAVTLFVERARARRSGFQLTERNAPAVGAICRRLEGLPLAIELAAAQVDVLPPAEIARRLDDTLRLLGGGSRSEPRQETLRAALDWSHDLLDERERTLMRRLAIFAGGFDLEAAECICGGDDPRPTLPLLTTLIQKSLVEGGAGVDEARYRLLEPIRQYAWEKLAEHGEVSELGRRHAHYFLALAERAEPYLMSGKRGPWIERLTRERDNLRAVLSWSLSEGEAAIGLRLAGALAFYWVVRGEISEGLEWTEAALAASEGADPAVRAGALYAACELGWHAGRNEVARARAEESVAIWRALGDKRRLAYALQSLPMIADHPRARESEAESLRLFAEIDDPWGAALALGGAEIFPMLQEGDPTGRARDMLEDGLVRSRALGDDWLTAQRLNFLGDLLRSQGDHTGAAAAYEEALAALRRAGLLGTVPSLLHNLGHLAVRRGDTRRALRLFRESLMLFRDQGDQKGIADCLDGIACTLASMRQPERAASLFATADTLRGATGAAVWPSNAADRECGLALVRDQLGADALAGIEALPWEQAVGEVLATDGPSADTAVPHVHLSPREWEVAALVAEGLTNREIGRRLFITEGTARLHVKHILQKLGFRSRVEIARWVMEQDPTR